MLLGECKALNAVLVDVAVILSEDLTLYAELGR